MLVHRGGVGVEAEWRCCRRPAPHCLCQAHHSLHRMRPQGGPTTLLQARAETVKRGVAVEMTRSCLLSPADPTQTYCHTPSPHPKLSQHPLQGSPDKPPQSWFSSNQSQEPWNPPATPFLCAQGREGKIHSPVRCGLHTNQRPLSSLRYLGNPGLHPVQIPSLGQLPRATPSPQVHPQACTTMHTIATTEAGLGLHKGLPTLFSSHTTFPGPG